ncbi:hypothetical protein [Microcystis phage Mel-JY01]
MERLRFRTGKGIDVKMIPSFGQIACDYNHIYRTFGKPNFSVDAGDEFDGVEKCAWHIQFENGEVVRITDVREFGSKIDDYVECKRWNVNTLSRDAYEQVISAIRHHNPQMIGV